MRQPTARSVLAISCIFGLLVPSAFGKTPSQQVSKWPMGRRMEVTFTNGDKVIGRLGSTTSESFMLNPDKKSAGAPREIRYNEVQSVKSKWTTGEKWVIGVLIYAAVTILSATLLGT